jgi:hypothetical protein
LAFERFLLRVVMSLLEWSKKPRLLAGVYTIKGDFGSHKLSIELSGQMM